MSTNSVYIINRGVNRPIEFKGLRGQWIAWMAGGLVFLLIAFAALYIARVPLLLLVPGILFGGLMLLYVVFRLNKQHGEYGLMKWASSKRLPVAIRFRSRQVFTALSQGTSTLNHGNS